MDKNKSKDKCINENDYESAIYRFQNTTKRWFDYWWDCLNTIYENCTEFAKEYVLDPIRKEVVKIVQKTKAKIKNLVEGSNTYLIKIFDKEGAPMYTKVGKANNVDERMREIMRTGWKKGTIKPGNIEIVKTFNVPTDDLALVLESLMRNFLRKKYEFIPNDRFKFFEPTEEDLEAFENYYNVAIANA